MADLSVPNFDNESLAINPDDVRQSDPIAAAHDDNTFRSMILNSTRGTLLIDEQGRLSASALLGWVGELVISAH